MDNAGKRGLIAVHPSISIVRQCDLLGLSRSSFYYEPCCESAHNLNIMREMDHQYLLTPFFGVRMMCAHLRSQGYLINIKRVRRLWRIMGLEAITPKPDLSKPNKAHEVYPYLLRGVKVERLNQVWSTDITYIPMEKGFLYLTAVIDWYSRYVLSWELSNSQENSFCIKALEHALERYGRPEIFNTDQGSQFTAKAFTDVLKCNSINISMDGKGRATDNAFVERLWRSVKYEYVYLHVLENGWQLHDGLKQYFDFYNYRRLHSSLGYKTPADIYLNAIKQ